MKSAPMTGALLLVLSLPGAGQEARLTAVQEVRLMQAFCASDPCEDRSYGGCDDSQCLRWSIDAELGRLSEADERRYQEQCFPSDCPIAMPADTVMGDAAIGERTLEAIVDGWRLRREEAMNASCEDHRIDVAELLLPAEAETLSRSFEEALALVRCADTTSSRVRSAADRAEAARRNQERCIRPRTSESGCDSVPCNASPAEVAAWTTPRRNLCPLWTPDAQTLEVYVCAEKPDNLKRRDELVGRDAFGTLCPPAHDLAAAAGKGTCRLWVGPLPTPGARAALGCNAGSPDCVAVLAVLPRSRPGEDLLPLLPGFHERLGPDNLVVTTVPENGWGALSSDIEADDEVVVLSGAVATGLVFLERFRRGRPEPLEARILDGWSVDDLDVRPRQSCETEPLQRALGELAHLSRSMLAEDPEARPIFTPAWLPGAGVPPTFHGCFEFQGEPVCIEHRAVKTLPPPRDQPRTLAWRPELVSPLRRGAQAARWKALETYLGLRGRPVPDGARVGVVALDDQRPEGAAGLIGVTGEPSAILWTGAEARISPGGPVVDRYLAALGDPSAYRKTVSEAALERTLAVAWSAGDGVLATDPVEGQGRGNGACVVRADGPFCGRPGGSFEPLLAPDGDSDRDGLELFATAFEASRDRATATGWRPVEEALEDLLAAGAAPGSLVAIVPDVAGGRQAVLMTFPATSPEVCSATVRLVEIPAASDPSSAAFTVVPLSGERPNALCREQAHHDVLSIIRRDQLERLRGAAEALRRELAGDTEVYLGPADASRGGLSEIAVVRTGAASDGSEARVTLADPRLPENAGQPLETLARQLSRSPAASAGTLTERTEVLRCFLHRTCPDMQRPGRPAAAPISYFFVP